MTTGIGKEFISTLLVLSRDLCPLFPANETFYLSIYSAHVLARGLSPPPTADVIDITVLNDQLVISRPDPWVKR